MCISNFSESNSLTQWQRKQVQLTRNLTRLKLKVSQLSMWSARRPGVEMTMCGFTDKSWPCFIMSVNTKSRALCKTFSALSSQTENRQHDSNRCIYIYTPTLNFTIGRFNGVGLHKWMPFVIFCAGSCERSQCHFWADFWVGVVSRSV